MAKKKAKKTARASASSLADRLAADTLSEYMDRAAEVLGADEMAAFGLEKLQTAILKAVFSVGFQVGIEHAKTHAMPVRKKKVTRP